jgi:hypothetical protein
MRRITTALFLVAACWFAAYAASAAEITGAPQGATAGERAAVSTSGSGGATFYLVGPGHVWKEDVQLGEEIEIAGERLRAAGRYLAIVRQGSESSVQVFFVAPAAPADISFLARPSRVPAARPGAISGAAFVFDGFRNLVLRPMQVNFDLSVDGQRAAARNVGTRYGVAWTRMDSGRRAGAAQFVARAGEVSTRRVVQQVASDPCNLNMRARRTERALVVETDPVRDCAGNPVPDGTIVSFVQIAPEGRSTVDARIKRGVATAELPLAERATIYVASGVAVGNEIRLGGGVR